MNCVGLESSLVLTPSTLRRTRSLELLLRVNITVIATRCGSGRPRSRVGIYLALTASCSSPRLVEALVWLHRALGQPEEALIVLTYAQQRRQDVTIKVSWFKKLGRWQDALTSYVHALRVRARARARAARTRTRSSSAHAGEFTHGRMCCLPALSSWQQLTRASASR
jgi:hypothetical protein